MFLVYFFFSSRRRHTRFDCDWSSDVCSSDLTKGYSDQRLRLDGWQEDAEERFDVAATPLQPVRGPKGDPCLATVRLSGRSVSIGAWRVMVGRVPIFLLDTDLAQNDPADRGRSHRLYAGGPDL